MRRLSSLFFLWQIARFAASALPLQHFDAKVTPLAVTQDREGLLWIATPGALLRFDGLHFDPVPAPGDVNLAHVTQVAAAPNGSIWIGTETGLLEYRAGKFIRRIPGNIQALAVTPAGRVMASTGDHVFVILQPDREPSHYIRLPDVSVNGKFSTATDGTVWFGCRLSICAWSDADLTAAAAGKRWLEFPRFALAEAATGNHDPFHWISIVATPDGQLWGRRNVTVLQLERKGEYVHIVGRSDLPTQTFAGVRPGFLVDRHGRLWLPNRKLEVVSNGSPRMFPSDHEPLEDVSAVFEDRQGTLWFGIAGKGLVAMPDDSVLETYAGEEGLPGSVLDLIRHPRLGLLAATDSGAYAFDESLKRWRRVGPAADRTALRSVATGPNGVLLTAPYRGGLLLSESPFLTAREVALPAGFVRDRIRRLFADGRGGVWVGVLEGLFRLNARQQLDTVPLPPGGRHAADVTNGPDGTLWVGYEGGIGRCTADGCTRIIGPEDALLDPKLRTIAVAENEIWVSYWASVGSAGFPVKAAGGWRRISDPKMDTAPPIQTSCAGTVADGSGAAPMRRTVSDGRHTAVEDWLRFTFGDRPNSTNTNIYPFHEEADGSVWIRTQAGIVCLHPRSDWFEHPDPRAVRAMQSGTEFHLSYPGMPSFMSRQFRYRLLPLTTEWRVTSTGTLRYADLPHG